MKLIYDARWLRTDGVFDGISRYSHELAWALSRRDDCELILLVCDERQLAQLPQRPHLLVNDPANVIAEMRLPARLNREHPNIVYSPFFIMGSRGRQYKLVLTIHDLIYFHHRTPPHWFAWYVRAAWWLFYSAKWPMRLVLGGADAIATVSDTARQELIDEKMTEREITTVYNAASKPSEEVGKSDGEDLALPAGASQDKNNQLAASRSETADLTTDHAHFSSKTIVYMGAFTQYKNVELLIDAMEFLPDISLHLLSKIPVSRRRELEARIRTKNVVNQIIIHDGVSDDEYKKLLTESRCLVTASRLEGFGLPLIEAQALGVPIACSDTPIFREVAGDSALFFDPDTPEQCADAVRQLGHKTTSQKMIARGFDNIKRFSWDTSAQIAIDLAKKLV